MEITDLEFSGKTTKEIKEILNEFSEALVQKIREKEKEEKKLILLKTNEFQELFKKDRIEGIDFIVQFLMNNYNFLLIGNDIFYYKDGIYLNDGEKIIEKEIQRCLDKLTTNHIVDEIKGQIKRKIPLEFKEAHPRLICLENGILNVDTLEINEHSPEHIFFSKIPVFYNLEAKCPKIEEFLTEIISSEDIKIIEKLFAFLLIRNYFIQEAVVFIGSGANGKSTLINLIKEFLGSENCIAISLQELENNRFAFAGFHGKLANLYPDLPSKVLKDSSFFKQLTGKDLIKGERKFGKEFYFRNYAKLIFSANQIPDVVSEDTDAFFRRWVIINFPNQFIGDKDNSNILEELTAKEELSGLLNIAIEKLKEIWKLRSLKDNKNIEETRKTYIKLANSAKAFIIELIEEDPESYVIKEELYNSYLQYCRKISFPSFSEKKFFQTIKQECDVLEYRPKIENKQKYCFKGIRLKLLGEKPTTISTISTISTLDRVLINIDSKKGGVSRGVDPRYSRNPTPELLDINFQKELPKNLTEEQMGVLIEDAHSQECVGCGLKTDYLSEEELCEVCQR